MKLMKNHRGDVSVGAMICGFFMVLSIVIVLVLLGPYAFKQPTAVPTGNSWCPEVMVTIETIVAKENHVDENRIPNNEAVKPAFLKLPYVVLSNVEGTNIKYEGYVMSSPFPNDMTSLLDYQRNKIPLCVDIVRMGVFVLYEPLELK